MKEMHNAGVDAMLSNDGWAPVAAPGFQRSDGWALHVWKRYFATGSTYVIKTKELMVGGVVSKVLSKKCKAGNWEANWASSQKMCESPHLTLMHPS